MATARAFAGLSEGSLASRSSITPTRTSGFEYRMREWRNPETHEIHWVLERRKTSRNSEDDS